MSLRLGKCRKKKRLPERVKRPLEVPTQPNVCWSLDLRSDALTDGRRFRPLNVIEDWNWEVAGIEVDISLLATRVVALLTQLVRRHGVPTLIRVDNSPELLNVTLFTSLRQVREQCQLWQYDYNHLRPHQTLNFLTSIEY